MGQWSHRRRRGGGESPLNFIIHAHIQTAARALVTYQFNINAGIQDPTTFQSTPSGEVGFSIAQSDARTLDILFDNPITGDILLTYTGNIPGILTPQTIAYT